MKKLLAVSATALLVSLPLAVPAWALPTGAGVGEGRNISVFHNLDFVATFGHPVDAPIAVDVFRDGVQIGHAFGNTVSAPEDLPLDGALEVNHGPEVAAVQGDCWEGFTPDIIPGDHIVVSDNADPTNPVVLDEVLVDDITMSAPREDLTTEDPSDVIVEGKAAYADGTPIPVDQLNSGEIRVGSRFRANPNEVVRTPGTTDGYRAVYKAPYNIGRNRDNVDPKQAILDGDHAMGYGHVAPLPSETQMVEGLGGGGPALGCESAPKQANAVTTSDDEVINLASDSLNLSGTAMEAVSAVRVTLSDTDPNTDDVAVDATALSAGPGEKTWSASFTREEVESQADGTLTASGAYTLPGGTIGGATKEIDKDTAITVGDVNLADASDTGNGDVGSGSDDLTSDATPTLNGTAEAGSTVEVFDGATPLGQTTAGSGGDWELTVAPDKALGNGAHPLKASATDAAGNAAESANALTVTVDTSAPAVTASPQGGLFRTPQNVNLTLANAAQETGTRIYFTLDGSVPQPIAEQLYSGPINVPNTQTQRLKYRALDRAGNISATGTQVYRFDTVAPRIIARSPAVNAIGVNPAANVRVTFNEAVTGVGDATFRLRQGATAVPAVVTYNAATRTAVLNPDANLVSGKKYTVTLTGGIRDSVGNRLAPVSWSFTAR